MLAWEAALSGVVVEVGCMLAEAAEVADTGQVAKRGIAEDTVESDSVD